jgi:glucosamine--fructose-6-phosphate aminotransferase (isomerizing)
MAEKAATSISCSRKFTSSRAPFAIPPSAASVRKPAVFFDEMDISPKQFREFRQIKIIACGTSCTRRSPEIHDREARSYPGRSRLRQRVPLPRSILGSDTLTVVISQSGETADTLAAQREAKQKGSKTLAICNVVGSMITRGGQSIPAGPRLAWPPPKLSPAS